MRVLIVEDDHVLGNYLRKGLSLQGYDTDWVTDGEAALESLRRQEPELLVLDLSLPKKDGVEILAHIQSWALSMAVVVLTGRNDVEERIRCLDLGADDCLLKPFNIYELVARCRAIARRRQADRIVSTLKCGSIAIDLLSRKVWSDGRPVDLTRKEFALLEYMVRRPGECCSRESLLRDLWGMKSESVTNVVDVYVTYLRKKLTPRLPDGPAKRSVIETVRGAGYRIAAIQQIAA